MVLLYTVVLFVLHVWQIYWNIVFRSWVVHILVGDCFVDIVFSLGPFALILQMISLTGNFP